MRALAMAVLVLSLSGCSCRPRCPTGDLDCLAASFSIQDFDDAFAGATKKEPLTVLQADVPGPTADGGLTLASSSDLTLAPDDDGTSLVFDWSDANACRPAFCLSHCPKGVRCASGGRCTPARNDGLSRAVTIHWADYGARPVETTEFDLNVTALSAPGCPLDVAGLLNAGDGAAVTVSLPVTVRVVLQGEGGAGGGSGGGGGGTSACGTGLRASTLSCTPLGTGGVADTCVSDAEYRSVFGVGVPALCAPPGTTGCMDTQKGALVKPCCPNFTCKVGSTCGGGSTFGGSCQ